MANVVQQVIECFCRNCENLTVPQVRRLLSFDGCQTLQDEIGRRLFLKYLQVNRPGEMSSAEQEVHIYEKCMEILNSGDEITQNNIDILLSVGLDRRDEQALEKSTDRAREISRIMIHCGYRVSESYEFTHYQVALMRKIEPYVFLYM